MSERPDLFAGILPFVLTAEERSFGRAARSLGVTTAAISKAIRRLEEDLGVKLLDRSSRSVTVTRAGEVFLDRCRRAVLDVRGARELVQGSRRDPQGEVALTLPFILAPFVVPHLVQLGDQHPRLTFRLSLSDRVVRLADENFDVAIRMGELEPSRLITRHLRDTRWVTVAAPSYLARRSPLQTPADLAQHNCLRFLAPDGRPRDWSFADASGSTTIRVEGNLLVDHGSYVLEAAEAAMGVCQVLDFMVERSLRDGRLVEVLAHSSAAGPKIHALSTPGRARTAAVRAVIRFLLETFRA